MSYEVYQVKKLPLTIDEMNQLHKFVDKKKSTDTDIVVATVEYGNISPEYRSPKILAEYVFRQRVNFKILGFTEEQNKTYQSHIGQLYLSTL